MKYYKDDLPDCDYHANPAISSTDLRNFLKTPAHYYVGKHSKHEASPAMVFGSAFHLRVLQPCLFESRVVVEKSAPKAKRDALEADGKYLITDEDRKTIEYMVSSLEAHETAAALLWHPSAVYERSYFWDWDGLTCKCRPDVERRDLGLLIDLKTTTDASPGAFQKSIAGFGYHYQAQHYLTGVSAVSGYLWNTFLFVAVEKSPPFGVGVYKLDGEALEIARVRLQDTYDGIKEHIATDHWPAYPDEIVEISLPRWAA
jgi:exodeoxyribonuclease VIII